MPGGRRSAVQDGRCGWHYRPKKFPEKEVLEWFKDVIDKFLKFIQENGLTLKGSTKALGTTRSTLVRAYYEAEAQYWFRKRYGD
jgi:hypothetical protein